MALLSESPVVLPIHRKILAFSFIGWIFDFYDLLLLTFLVSSTSIVKDLALSTDQVAVLLGTALAFTAVGGFIGGALADRYGRKPLLMITILIYSIGTLLSGMSIGFWTLLAARALTGVGVGGEWAVAHAMVAETVPPAVRGRYGSYLQSGSAFARFFASMVGSLLAPLIGWRLAFMLSALPALVVVAIRRQMPESDVWLLSVKNGVSSRLGYAAALGQMLGPALRKTTALALSVTTFNMAAYWFKTIWLPTYLHVTRGLSLADVTWLLLMDQIGSVIGYVAFGFASDRFGRRPSFTAFSVIKAVGLAMITLGWTAAGGYSATTFGFMVLVGFGEGNWGCIGPLLNEVFPTSVRAAALGIIYNTARGVQFLAPVIIGWVAVRATFGAGIALAVPFSLIAGAMVWTLPETKGVRLMDSEGDHVLKRLVVTLAIAASAIALDAASAFAQAAPGAAHTEVAIDVKLYDGYVGRYQLAPAAIITVTRTGDRLYTQLTGQPAFELFPESEKIFFLKVVDAQMTFETDQYGKATAVVVHQMGIDQRARRIDGEPIVPKQVAIDPQVFDRYAGRYTFSPGQSLTLSRESEHFYVQLTGQPKAEIFASSEREFFLKVVDAQITIELDGQARATAVVLHQLGRDQRATRGQ